MFQEIKLDPEFTRVVPTTPIYALGGLAYDFEIDDVIIRRNQKFKIIRVDYSKCVSVLETLLLPAKKPQAPIHPFFPKVDVFMVPEQTGRIHVDPVPPPGGRRGFVPSVKSHEKKFITHVLENPHRFPKLFAKTDRLRRQKLFYCIRGVPDGITKQNQVDNGELSRFYAPLSNFVKNIQKPSRQSVMLAKRTNSSFTKHLLDSNINGKGDYNFVTLLNNLDEHAGISCIRSLGCDNQSFRRWLESFRDEHSGKILWSRIPVSRGLQNKLKLLLLEQEKRRDTRRTDSIMRTLAAAVQRSEDDDENFVQSFAQPRIRELIRSLKTKLLTTETNDLGLRNYFERAIEPIHRTKYEADFRNGNRKKWWDPVSRRRILLELLENHIREMKIAPPDPERRVVVDRFVDRDDVQLYFVALPKLLGNPQNLALNLEIFVKTLRAELDEIPS